MTKALKELIENAPTIERGRFSKFMIVSNGEYKGFWGKNGYNNIIVFGRLCGEDMQWYKLCEVADKFTVFDLVKANCTFNLDIPKKFGVPVIWFDRPIDIDYSIPTSDIFGYVAK